MDIGSGLARLSRRPGAGDQWSRIPECLRCKRVDTRREHLIRIHSSVLLQIWCSAFFRYAWPEFCNKCSDQTVFCTSDVKTVSSFGRGEKVTPREYTFVTHKTHNATPGVNG
jgi:hypothetical protein